MRAENFCFRKRPAQKIANFATTEAPFEIALLLTLRVRRAWMLPNTSAANAFIDALRPGDRVAIIALIRQCKDKPWPRSHGFKTH